MNITEQPERWVIVQIPDGYKVFGSWAGGYLYSDRWKFNSGIKEIKSDEDYYYFIGYSGSCYKCLKKAYGYATSWTKSVINNIIEKSNGLAKVMEKRVEWNNLLD